MNSNLFLTNMPVKVLLHLGSRGYSPKTYIEIKVTYCHLVNLLKLLNQREFITIEKVGRTKKIEVTEKGRLVVENLIKIKNILRDRK